MPDRHHITAPRQPEHHSRRRLPAWLGALALTLILGYLLAVPATHAQADTNQGRAADLQPSDCDSQIAQVVVNWIQQKHFNTPELNNQVSGYIFEEYFAKLDPERRYFLQADVDEFAPYRDILDDQLRRGELDFAFQVYARFLQRVDERLTYLKARVDEPFDFTIQEEMVIDRSEQPWAKTSEELDDIWRQNLKNQALVAQLREELQQTAAADTSEDATAPQAEEPAEAEAEATEAEEPSALERYVKRHQEYHELLTNRDNSDVLELFLSTFTQIFDPHSTYFNWRTTEDFDISMKLSLQGIGATLTMEDGYTKVISIVPGGPAAKDGRLQPGDLIIEVAQADGVREDVVNMPLDKVVRRIRGEKGTDVLLYVAKNPHEAPQMIRITRDEVKLKEQEAKGEVETYEAPNGETYNLGIIYLPSFYADFEAQQSGDPDAKSTTADVKRIIDQMVEEDDIDGLVVDLRWNGGGALPEAINLAGLFIPSGPIVQVRERFGVQVYPDSDGGFAYDLPLAVMTNHASASASEIFAAAIQDYGRGVIVGDEMTHGKGTVQTVRKLDKLKSLRDCQPGALKYTMAKFYRINGGSTQQRGVTPDFVLPNFLDHIVEGESQLKHVMPWDEIEPRRVVRAKPDMRTFLPTIREQHERRLAEDEQFNKLVSDIHQFGKRRANKTMTLNLDKRIVLSKEDREWSKRSDEVLSKTKMGKLQHSTDLYEATEDFYTRETFNILGDVIELMNPPVLTQNDQNASDTKTQ